MLFCLCYTKRNAWIIWFFIIIISSQPIVHFNVVIVTYVYNSVLLHELDLRPDSLIDFIAIVIGNLIEKLPKGLEQICSALYLLRSQGLATYKKVK